MIRLLLHTLAFLLGCVVMLFTAACVAVLLQTPNQEIGALNLLVRLMGGRPGPVGGGCLLRAPVHGLDGREAQGKAVAMSEARFDVEIKQVVRILPCPFCGARGKDLDFIVIEDRQVMQCQKCGALGPPTAKDGNPLQAAGNWSQRATIGPTPRV